LLSGFTPIVSAPQLHPTKKQDLWCSLISKKGGIRGLQIYAIKPFFSTQFHPKQQQLTRPSPAAAD